MFRRIKQFFSRFRKPKPPINRIELAHRIEFIEAQIVELERQTLREPPSVPEIRMPGGYIPPSPTQVRKAQLVRELEKLRKTKKKLDSQQ